MEAAQASDAAVFLKALERESKAAKVLTEKLADRSLENVLRSSSFQLKLLGIPVRQARPALLRRCPVRTRPKINQ